MTLTVNSKFILRTSAIFALYHIDLQIATAFKIYLLADNKTEFQIKRALFRALCVLHLINSYSILRKDHFSFFVAQVELHKGLEFFLG